MAEWEIERPIDYSANGDDIDAFAQKSKATFEQIFTLLNKLRSNGAQAGTDITGAEPYSWLIDTSTETIYMTKVENGQLVLKELGDIDTYFGLTAEKIGAVRNRENSMGSLMCGSDANKPLEGNNTHDLYWAYDTSKVYSWTGSAWKVELSLNFADILDYERYCVAMSEVATSGANKILRLDSQGKANVDITGSPERLLGLLIDVQNLRDDHVLVYDAAKGKIVNKPRNDISRDDVTYTGEAGKLAGIAEDGKLHADLEGSASEIDELVVEATGMQEGQVLSLQNGRLKPVDKDEFTEDDVTETGEAGKLLRMGDDGKAHVSITGSAPALGGVVAEMENIQDGDVLVFHESSGKLIPESKGTVGTGKYLIIRDSGNVLGEYNGSETVDLDFGIIIKRTSDSVVNHLDRLVGNLYLALELANMSPTGYDGMIVETFDGDCEEMDRTAVTVTSIVSGDDSIDVSTSAGLLKGSYYQLADGNNTEEVMIKEINVSKGINRIILTENVKHQFDPFKTTLFRSNAAVSGGKVYGGDNKKFVDWLPGTVWQGYSGASQITTVLQSTLDKANEFTLSGDTTFTSDGYMTLDTTIKHDHGFGVKMVLTGGGFGRWLRTDGEGYSQLFDGYDAVLENNTWAQIKQATEDGIAPALWAVGDKKAVELNGAVGQYTFAGDSYDAQIIGFDHNSAIEGSYLTHFMFGQKDGVDIAFCDGEYGTQGSTSAFRMNLTSTNADGWSGSYMRNTICAQFKNALPAALQDVMVPVAKHSDNVGGGTDTAANVTGTMDRIFLLSEWEVQGARTCANSAEQNKQKQYAYYANGASKVRYKHSDETSAVWWWLRSACYINRTPFCSVNSSGGASYTNAYNSGGFAPAFAVGHDQFADYDATLANNTPEQIQRATRAGLAPLLWSVGDTYPVTLNGTVGIQTFSNETYYASIIGFDHNASVETGGNPSTTFILGKNANDVDIAFCDSKYNTNVENEAAFHMNMTNTNAGGWNGSYMRGTILPQLKAALPSSIQGVISNVTKYSDNTGGGSDTASYVTATTDDVFLLSEWEVQGARTYANSAEQSKQQQYQYYANGASKVRYKHSDASSAVWWWLRSAGCGGSGYFCRVGGGGGAYGGSASGSGGFAPGFVIV